LGGPTPTSNLAISFNARGVGSVTGVGTVEGIGSASGVGTALDPTIAVGSGGAQGTGLAIGYGTAVGSVSSSSITPEPISLDYEHADTCGERAPSLAVALPMAQALSLGLPVRQGVAQL